MDLQRLAVVLLRLGKVLHAVVVLRDLEKPVVVLEIAGPIDAPGEQRLEPRNRQIGRAHVELQSLMRISYAVFCLKKKKNTDSNNTQIYHFYNHDVQAIRTANRQLIPNTTHYVY